MLGNVLLAFAPANAAPPKDDILGRLVICTSHGVQELASEGDVPKPADRSGSHCSACTLVKSFALALVSSLLELQWPAEIVVQIGWRPTPGAVSQLKLGGIGSRAPPASA